MVGRSGKVDRPWPSSSLPTSGSRDDRNGVDSCSQYPGGKNGAGVWQWIVGQLPSHRNYAELFAGSAAVFRNKPPAPGLSVLIDLEATAPALTMRYREYSTATASDAAGVPGRSLEQIHGCGLEWLETYASQLDSNWLLYLDPPYPLQTRTKKKIYRHEFTTAQHARMLDLIGQLDCRIMVSSYYSRQYAQALNGWAVTVRTVTTRGGPRAEHLWKNFDLIAPRLDKSKILPAATPAAASLAAGPDFRERFRAKRKANRWVTRLAELEHWERAYILERLEPARAATETTCGSGNGKPGVIVALEESRLHVGPITPAESRPKSGRRLHVGPRMPAESRAPADSRHELVLSLFPGIDLLGRGFEAAGFTVLRGPDTILDSRIEDFQPPAPGQLDGIIGGPPCQNYSDANRIRDPELGDRLVLEFLRCIDESRPNWFLMENVRNVPDIQIDGYTVQRLGITDIECGGKQKRLRHIQFGSMTGDIIRPTRTNSQRSVTAAAVLCRTGPNDRHSRRLRMQGAPALPLRSLTKTARARAIGNAVPFTMAKTLAEAVK